ncbi:MAG: 3D domain-containing protein [Prolixibacteraceae bacterium]
MNCKTRYIKFKKEKNYLLPALFLFIVLVSSCNKYETVTKEVVATAYNSLAYQTHAEHSNITAWGDTLKPGMKSIAVSRDLIRQGLTHNKKVKIEGLPGVYKVLDKMNPRWNNRIDIYMGENVERAKEWGRQKVTISYKVKKEKYTTN